MRLDGLYRIGAVAGVLGVVGNIVGVATLRDIPSAYRPDEVATWTRQVLLAPWAASSSGVAFTVGLVALAGWAVVMGVRLGTSAAWVGAFLVAVGALFNAVGTLAPLVVFHLLAPACGQTDGCLAASMAVLGSALALDALFNLLLGVGLLFLGRAMFAAAWPSWLGWLTMVAGVASIPVSLQVMSPTGADLLLLAGPLWLTAISICSVRLWRESA